MILAVSEKVENFEVFFGNYNQNKTKTVISKNQMKLLELELKMT